MREKRLAARMMCADLLHACFPDEHGNIVRTSAILEDLSPAGACIQFECPIPVGCRIAIAHPKGELRGVVKYCVFRDIGYYAGLEFDESSMWSPERFLPEYRLDLEPLLAAAGAKKEEPS